MESGTFWRMKETLRTRPSHRNGTIDWTVDTLIVKRYADDEGSQDGWRVCG